MPTLAHLDSFFFLYYPPTLRYLSVCHYIYLIRSAEACVLDVDPTGGKGKNDVRAGNGICIFLHYFASIRLQSLGRRLL